MEQSWISYILWGATMAGILAVATWWQRRRPENKVLLDRTDPQKHWAHAAVALYQGEAGDPGHWPAREAASLLQEGWSTADRQALIELIDRYIQGECNVGFDKIRIIWLARLGFGAGWLDEGTSWHYVFAAQDDLRRTYASWPELKAAVAEGRSDWYGGADRVPPPQLQKAEDSFAYANKQFFSKVPFR